jgi:hypothetical protein
MKMKKLSMLILVAILVTTLLAAAPTGKLFRLTVINASGDTVYIQLEGEVNEMFYYLTIPDGEEMTFTLVPDFYKRTTWACGGTKSSGELIMTNNVRLRFVECGTAPMRWTLTCLAGEYNAGNYWCYDPYTQLYWEKLLVRKPNYGEPTQEKVVYWKYVKSTVGFVYGWCGVYTLSTKSVKYPVGCSFRYQY